MKVFTNDELIENRAKWARRVAPFTMLFLIGGLVTNFLSINNPAYFRPTLILLGLGFVSAIISSNLVNNWVREPRADQVLTQVLKKFGNDYLLFNYTTVVPHVLIAPDGVYTFVVKKQDGEITVNGNRFKRKFTWRRFMRMFADESLGAPVRDAEVQMNKLQKLLEKEFDEEEEMPEIKPLILFSSQELELNVNNPELPVMTTSELKSFLREQSKERTISASQRRELAEIFEA